MKKQLHLWVLALLCACTLHAQDQILVTNHVTGKVMTLTLPPLPWPLGGTALNADGTTTTSSPMMMSTMTTTTADSSSIDPTGGTGTLDTNAVPPPPDTNFDNVWIVGNWDPSAPWPAYWNIQHANGSWQSFAWGNWTLIQTNDALVVDWGTNQFFTNDTPFLLAYTYHHEVGWTNDIWSYGVFNWPSNRAYADFKFAVIPAASHGPSVYPALSNTTYIGVQHFTSISVPVDLCGLTYWWNSASGTLQPPDPYTTTIWPQSDGGLLGLTACCYGPALGDLTGLNPYVSSYSLLSCTYNTQAAGTSILLDLSWSQFYSNYPSYPYFPYTQTTNSQSPQAPQSPTPMLAPAATPSSSSVWPPTDTSFGGLSYPQPYDNYPLGGFGYQSVIQSMPTNGLGHGESAYLDMRGWPGWTYLVSSSTNLLNPQWAPVGTVLVLTNGMGRIAVTLDDPTNKFFKVEPAPGQGQ